MFFISEISFRYKPPQIDNHNKPSKHTGKQKKKTYVATETKTLIMQNDLKVMQNGIKL